MSLLAALLRLTTLRWLGVCVILLTPLLNAVNSASAHELVQTKTRVGGFESAAPLHIWLNGTASERRHLGNWRSEPEVASGSLLAARGGEKILSNQVAGKIIGWPKGQAAAARTAEMAKNLTADRVGAMQAQGLNRATAESLRGTYQKAIEAGGAKLQNEQLLPRAQLMDRILELWPK